MSLINQMLRDLETRRKKGARQLPSGEVPIVFVEPAPSSRLIYLAVGGLVLAGAIWAVLELVPQPLPVTTARVPIAQVAPLIVAKQAAIAASVVAPEEQAPAVELASVTSGTTAVAPKAEVLALVAQKIAVPEIAPQLAEIKVVLPAVFADNVVPVKAVERKATNQNRVSKNAPTLNRDEQADLAYRNAMQQLQSEDFVTAEAKFSHALALQPQHLDARLQLIGLLQNLRRVSEANRQVLIGQQLHPDNPELRKNYARSLLAGGQLDEALAALQREPQPEVGQDLEYHALLAALFQETGEYQSAIKGYTRLLSYRSQEALWWMGLAISLDQSGAATKAKEAYQQAIVLPGLRADLQKYINSRLQVL